MAKKAGGNPGAKAPASGQYGLVGSRGGNGGKEITVVKGDTLPPTPKPGQSWVLVDPTKNNSGKV
jgi:hypothetical protein